MERSEKTITRGWLAVLIGTALLVGGLVALCFPVFLGSYDKYGIQIKGNGYHAELLQASLDDQESASAATHPATSCVAQCNSSPAHRRLDDPGGVAGAPILFPTFWPGRPPGQRNRPLRPTSGRLNRPKQRCTKLRCWIAGGGHTGRDHPTPPCDATALGLRPTRSPSPAPLSARHRHSLVIQLKGNTLDDDYGVSSGS
jgi:hypothetical protein